MKKTIKLLIIPTLSGITIITALHQLIGYSQISSVNMLDHNQTDVIVGLIGFLFGFLPCFFYGLATSALEALNPNYGTEPQEIQVLQPLPVYTGMLITSPGANCALRIKSLKVSAILEFSNPDYQDYL